MTSLIFASNNANKVAEIKAILPEGFEIISLKEAGILIDIPEPFDSLEQNARAKSRTIRELTGKDCFSEDTGLEVEALGNEPGVRSARYAGEQSTAEENTKKLLERLQDSNNRKARFRTVISLILNGQEYQFEGICTGYIAQTPSGNNGFGYDTIFIPEGSDKSFGEMYMEEKSRYSHRKKAMNQLVSFLNKP